SLLGSGAAATGQGVQISEIRTDFSQGNIEFTSNALDLAISGNGFFVLKTNDGGQAFSRAGGFRVDREGFLTNAQGLRLQGFQATDSGEIVGVLDDLFIDTTLIEPQGTISTTLTQNLDSRDLSFRASGADPRSFDPADPLTYNSSTSTTIYDSLGNPHVLNIYYVKEPDLTNLDAGAGAQAAPTGAVSAYAVYATVDGIPLYDTGADPANANANVADDFPTGYLTFDSSGGLIDDGAASPIFSPTVVTSVWTPIDANGNPNGATGGSINAPVGTLQLDLGATTQFGTDFAVSSIVQDGFGAGQLIAFEISADGTAFARFTNGQSRAIGQVALASFNNNNGLQPIGDTNFAETFESGAPTIGDPGNGGRGVVQSSAVETANVDITAELVSLIIAQRNFQANAQVISANDQLTTAIINLR
ncbi:MAG: flagellar hook protein FlgE, partial [Halieaceae bacterium]|nr:flagellar hook protein FlgE [Halieaceae bacterium]